MALDRIMQDYISIARKISQGEYNPNLLEASKKLEGSKAFPAYDSKEFTEWFDFVGALHDENNALLHKLVGSSPPGNLISFEKERRQIIESMLSQYSNKKN